MTTEAFSTDNAAPCWRCSGTVANYSVDPAVTIIDVQCVACGARDIFDIPSRAQHPTTAAQCSAAHRRTR